MKAYGRKRTGIDNGHKNCGICNTVRVSKSAARRENKAAAKSE